MSKEFKQNYPVCTWPGGWQGNTRHVVVDNLIVNESRTHILLVQRSPGEIEGETWALPGGYVEPDETIVEAVTKETLEETGLHIGRVALFRIVDNPKRRNETAQNITAVFVTVVDDQPLYGEIPQPVDPDGGTQAVMWWHRLDGLPSMAFDHREIIAEFTANPTTYPLDLFMSTSRPS